MYNYLFMMTVGKKRARAVRRGEGSFGVWCVIQFFRGGEESQRTDALIRREHD